MMVTFAQLKDNRALLTSDITSPIFHPNHTMTVIWEGESEGEEILCLAEWMERPVALEHIPGTNLWGGDFPAPDLPRTVCTRIEIGDRRRALSSPCHIPDVLGPDVPPTLPMTGPRSSLVDDLWLPAPGLVGEKRRVRIYKPQRENAADPLDALFVLDAQMVIDLVHWFPALTDTLDRQHRVPPLLIVALDHAGDDRPNEYVAGERNNEAGRRWIWDTVVPYVERHHQVRARWIHGASLGASMALQLALARPTVFAGGAFLSPVHRTGRSVVFALVDHWAGGGRFFISNGTFGRGEEQHRADARALGERLAVHGTQVSYVEREGYGHAFAAWERILPEGLSWLFAERWN